MVNDEATSRNRAVIVLVLGVLGLVTCPPLGLVAWWLGHRYRVACRRAGVPIDVLGDMGWILGIVATVAFLGGIGLTGVMWVASWVLMVVLIVLGAVAGVVYGEWAAVASVLP